MGEIIPKSEAQLRIERQAYGFCDDILRAAELHEIAGQTADLAQRATSHLISNTIFSNLPFSFEISPEPGVKSHVSRDDEVVEINPPVFRATELRSMSGQSVEFYDRDTNRWLRLKGKFNIQPIFDKPESE